VIHSLFSFVTSGSFFDRVDLRHSDKKNNVSNEFLNRGNTTRSALIDSPIHAKIRNSINHRDKDIRMKNVNTSIGRITARSEIASRSLIGVNGSDNDNDTNPDYTTASKKETMLNSNNNGNNISNYNSRNLNDHDVSDLKIDDI
jgi:hypothetical protein